jgi:hypothetical protein
MTTRRLLTARDSVASSRPSAKTFFVFFPTPLASLIHSLSRYFTLPPALLLPFSPVANNNNTHLKDKAAKAKGTLPLSVFRRSSIASSGNSVSFFFHSP